MQNVIPTAVTSPGRVRTARAFGMARGMFGAVLPPAAVVSVMIVAWAVYVRLSGVKPYLVPAPDTVFARWTGDLSFFYGEGWTTLQEALAGLALGGGLAVLLATVLAHSRLLERGVLPVAVALKVTPIVAIAPLFTIWFGFGLAPKVLIAALVAFFPMLISGITGFRAVNAGTLDVLRSVDASPLAIFFRLRLPSALPYLFAALKVSATLALIGALVAEWANAAGGLGRVIWLANSNLDTPTLFAAILTLATLGVALNSAIALIERRLLFWHDAFRDRP